jgi:transcriptional regulator with XRE-family HTH domain
MMFYDKIELLCAKKGISITKLTNLLGLSSSVITGWKNGAKPRLSTIKMIGDFFRVSPDYLLSSKMYEEAETPARFDGAAAVPDGYDTLTDEEKQEIHAIIRFFIDRKKAAGNDYEEKITDYE